MEFKARFAKKCVRSLARFVDLCYNVHCSMLKEADKERLHNEERLKNKARQSKD